MLDFGWHATGFWQAIVWNRPFRILPFVVARWTSARIVVHEIVALPWSASTFRTVGDVGTIFREKKALTHHLFDEPTVTDALVVVPVRACWLCKILTMSVRCALITRRGAIIIVDASRWIINHSRRLAGKVKLKQYASELSIFGVARLTLESRLLPKLKQD
jgi:hypothetical protein